MQPLQLLNAPTPEERLNNLQLLLREETQKPAVSDVFVNNHIHTTFSFSPYSPTAAVWFARAATLPTAGIMDHDSMAGAREFIRAGELAGVATTVGIECRVRMDGTGLEDRYINNTDQTGLAYMSLHGVPHGQIDTVQRFFAPLREKRGERNRKMVQNINTLLAPHGIALDYDAHVLPLSEAANGGSVTERHLIFALSRAILASCGKAAVPRFLTDTLHLHLSDKQQKQLTDENNPFYEYDLLGVLKSAFVAQIYVPAEQECLTIGELSALAKRVDALLCYAYLGDVGESVTGDKRSGCFEDSYLETLFDVLHAYDTDAITYMPSRNTRAQLDRVRALCEQHRFMQISGEDINSPRQSFICTQLADPAFQNLVTATWELIKREKERS